jgi:hypothetical protein
MKYQDKLRNAIPLLHEALMFGSVYFFVTLINLRVKLLLTPAWFNGILASNHEKLLAFQYANNEQSRLLQFYIPEGLRHLHQMSIEHAYIMQRGLFIFLVLLFFHFYLRKWFDAKLAFAGVMCFAAIMPLSYMNDLQESTPLLLLTFLLALWAIRDQYIVRYVLVLAIGSFNNETILILPLVFFLYNFKGFKPKRIISLAWITLVTSLPAYLIVGTIRYITRDSPRLAPLWQLPGNISSMRAALGASPLDWWQSSSLYIFFIFGVFWIFAYLKYFKKPVFLRRAALMIPFFIIAHMLAGIIGEVRLMLPLSFIVIPMSFFYLFPTNQYTQQLK